MEYLAEIIQTLVVLAIGGLYGYISALSRTVVEQGNRITVVETKGDYHEKGLADVNDSIKEVVKILNELQKSFAPLSQRRVTDHMHN